MTTKATRALRWVAMWAWPLLALAGTVYAVWLLFETHAASERDDMYLLYGIAGAYAVAILFLLAFTQRWTMRGLGQLATYAADAGLYFGAATGHALTDGERNLLRALFTVGAVCLVTGLFWWGIRTRGGTRDLDDDTGRKTWTLDPEPEPDPPAFLLAPTPRLDD